MAYKAITLDTNIFYSNNYALEHGLLKQLEQFKDSSIKFILSEIVVKEILRHITEEHQEIRDKLDSAINRSKRKKLISEDCAKQLVKIIQNEPSPDLLAQSRVNDFQRKTGFKEIGANNVRVDKLVSMYFDYKAPFENNVKKKKEFPDAIALLSIEEYAKSNNFKVLAVSEDKGWLDYADSSSFIDVTSNFTNALAQLQNSEDAIKEAVESYIATIRPGSNDYQSISSAIEIAVNNLDIMPKYDSYLRVNLEYVEVYFHDFSFIEAQSHSIIQIGQDFSVVELPVKIQAHASAAFDLYVYDSIDKDEVSIGGQSVDDMEVEFDASVLLKLEFSGEENSDIEITDIELIKAIDTVDFGYIEPHFEPDYDDYR